MVTIIIALLAIIVLMIQKAESTVNNEAVLLKIDLFHLKVKTQIQAIVDEPYAETRQKSTKWITSLFVLIGVLHYISLGIFGDNSADNLLRDNRVLIIIGMIMVIIIGHYNRMDLFKVGLVIAFVAATAIYALHSNMSSIGGAELLLAELPIGLVWKDIFVILGAIGFLGIITLFVLLARLISYMFYLVIRLVFKACLKLSPKKPLKVLIVMVECISILGVALMGTL